MFAAALIVFRETLEAALFVGIIAAATRELVGRGRWLAAGVASGALAAAALAWMAERISAWADGLGQDLVNVAILSLALAMLLWHCIWVSTHSHEMARDAKQLGAAVHTGQRKPWALLVAVALAVLREGAETVLFVAGSLTGQSPLGSGATVLACVLGLASGALAGALLYFGLSRIPVRRLFAVTNALIALLAAAIASQLAKALIQAGWLELGAVPLWDSTALLAPDSLPGTLLRALLGYDARPSGAQLVLYVGVLVSIYLGTRWAAARSVHPRR
jgi:high-affinity iron transporter